MCLECDKKDTCLDAVEESGLLSFAIRLAKDAHWDQLDKIGNPSINHSLSVMRSLSSESEAVQITAVLHDVVEDTLVTLDDVQGMVFSKEIVLAVDAISRREDERYFDYIDRVVLNSIARLVKIADVKDNLNYERMCRLPKDQQRSLTKRYTKALLILEEEKET
jgi:(p)ppGpp synthase/HD superfamily hydrolase